MEFNEINNVNINANNTKKDKKLVSKKETCNNIVKDLKDIPNNPAYWQNAVGIRTNVTFGQQKQEEITDDFIEERANKIKNYYHWVDEEKADLPRHRKVMKELIPFGKQVIKNYAKLAIFGFSQFWQKEDLENYNEILGKVIKILPPEEKEIPYSYISILEGIARLSNREERDNYLGILQALQNNQNSDFSTKVVWMNKILSREYKNTHPNFSSIEEARNSFDTFAMFYNQFGNMGTGKDDRIIEADLLDDEYNAILKLTKDEEISETEFKLFVFKNLEKGFYDKLPERKLMSVVSEINEDKNKKELFSKLISKKTTLMGFKSLDVLALFDGNIDFLNKAMTYLLDRAKEEKIGCLTSYGYNMVDFLSLLDESNFEDFKKYADEVSLEKAIESAKDYKNPKTELFDKNIYDKSTELSNRNMESYYVRSAAIAGIDKTTGNFSPIAQKVIDLFLPPIQEPNKNIKSKFNNIKRTIQTKTISKIQISSFGSNLSPLLESLKNDKGDFDKTNYKFLLKLLKSNKKQNRHSDIYVDDIAKIINFSKGENGVVDSRKETIILQVLSSLKNYQSTAEFFEVLNTFPVDKQNHIYNTCLSFGENERNKYKNFATFAKFCFDENGLEKPKNIDFVRKLLSLREETYSENFLNIYNEYPKLESFMLELAEKVEYTGSLYMLSDILKKQVPNGETPSEILKTHIKNYVQSSGELYYFNELYDACKIQGKLNEENFEKSLDLISLENTFSKNIPIITGKTCVDIINENLSISSIKFKDKANLLNALTLIRNQVINTEPEKYNYLDKAISDIEASLSLDDISLPIDNESKQNFINNVIFSGFKTELTNFEKTMISSIPMLEKMNDGLPLKYSREEFLNDLNQLCDNEETLALLIKKTGISPIFTEYGEEKKITGYNGIIKLNELDLNDYTQKQLYNCLNRFLYKNEVQTGNDDLDKQLNYIIKACPEFINTVGKKQQGTHAYTVDVHSLLVLAYSIQNPAYSQKLNKLDKSLLKISAIFHDIMKQEGVVDKGHQNLSSIYTRSIIKKVINTPEIQDRIFDLVDNHHWSEEYQTAQDKNEKARELAFKFRRPNDFEIAKIMADSDLKAVNESFYERLKGCLSSDNLAPIESNLNYIYSTGSVLFTNRILFPEKLKEHTETINGKEYTIINLHKIDDDCEMSQYGFEKGTKKKDLRFLVHMVDKHSIYDDLKTVKLLSSPLNGGVLSESLISPKYKRTYANREYGLLLSQINTNIVNQKDRNQGSGTAKDISNIIKLIFQNWDTEARNNFKNKLLENLGINSSEISDEDYADFYKNTLALKRSYSEINDSKEYKIGKYIITGEKLKQALMKYQDDIIDKTEKQHNEIVGYTPKIHAVIAKKKSTDELPEELLKFAAENNLPIILM